MKSKRINVLSVWGLSVILLCSFFLNFYKLDSIPSGLYVDEALSGYNAYSILHTGKDEYGKNWPILFRFFGSYSPPLYTYLTIPVLAINGLSVFSTRLLSAIAGVLTVFIVFNLLKDLGFFKHKLTPYLGALLMAISPWNILFARAGYEIYLGFCLFTLGVYFTWKGIKTSIYLIPGFTLLSLSTYAAHTERFLAPIFVLGFLILFRKKLVSLTPPSQGSQSLTLEWIDLFSKPRSPRRCAAHLLGVLTRFFTPKNKYLLISLALALLIQIPHLTILFTPAMWQKQEIFFSQGIIEQANQYFNWLPQPIAWTLALLRKFSAQYITYFSPRSLFFLPDPDPQRSIPDLSVFYPWMVIPYLIGLYLLWENRKKAVYKFIILLLMLTPLPAALTNDPFSTQRALPLLLPMIMVISIGIDCLISKTAQFRLALWIQQVLSFPRRPACAGRRESSSTYLPEKPVSRTKSWLTLISIPNFLLMGFFILLFLSSLVLLWRSYFFFLPIERAKVWGYGFQQLAKFISDHPQDHFISDQARTKPVYIELAFYLKLPPQQLQQSVDPAIKDNYYQQFEFNSERKFANIEIRNINWETDIYQPQIIIGDELAISEEQAQEHNLTQVLEIRDPLNQFIFRGYQTHPKEKCTNSRIKSQYCEQIHY